MDIIIEALPVILIIGGLIALNLYTSRWAQRRNINIVNSAISLLDGIYGGCRYIGKEAEVVTTLRVETDRYGCYLTYAVQLCRTKSGHWFEFSFGTSHGGEIVFTRQTVKPLTEREARERLESDPPKYFQIFGKPEVA